jgi:Flp pilus assembly protein TadD
MLRNIFCILVLAAVLIPSSLMAQAGIGSGGPSTLFGSLNIATKEGAQLPNSLFIVLYTTMKSVISRVPITNHGIYRFEKVANGDYEIVIEADGVDLVRMPYTVNTTVRNGEIRLNLDLDWREKSPAVPLKAGLISANDIYPRNTGNAALMAQATAASSKKSYAEAAKLLRTVVETDPKDFEAWTELGTAMFAQGNQGEAEKAFDRALEEHPDYPPAMSNLGKLNYTQKNYEAAIKILSQLVSAHPESAEARRFLGESYLRIKKGSLAVPQLEEAARLDPAGQAEAHLSLAALYDAAGLKDRAAAAYEKFLAIKPNYPEKKKLEKYIQENKKL